MEEFEAWFALGLTVLFLVAAFFILCVGGKEPDGMW